jgi:lysophospholipase L1-like esterase
LVLEGCAPFLARGLNDRIRAIAASYGVKVVEVFLPFYLQPGELIADDCVHPNDTGHMAIRDTATIAF